MRAGTIGIIGRWGDGMKQRRAARDFALLILTEMFTIASCVCVCLGSISNGWGRRRGVIYR